VTADNQRRTAEKLDALGIAKNLGGYSALTPASIEEAVKGFAVPKSGRELVDGKGADRVLGAMTSVSRGQSAG